MKQPKKPLPRPVLKTAGIVIKSGYKDKKGVALGQLEMRAAYYAFWARRGITDPPTY